MPSLRTGVVQRVLESRDGGVQVLQVLIDGRARQAVLHPRYAAPAREGDEVVLNTTAVDLGLGSGGYDHVVWNLSRTEHDSPSGGHVMKLRYTPLQTDVLAVEAPESPHHETLAAADTLGGAPVAAISVHSQLLPVVAGIGLAAPAARVAYVMTDGGALEAGWSNVARRLRETERLIGVVSTGHAVGGDLEAVNVYSGLLAARHVLGADVVVCGMGPGVVGTGTTFGTTALELGTIVNAAASLGGRPVACVRMSDTDVRRRHAGISHHALVALNRVALAHADVAVPLGTTADGIDARHRVVELDAEPVLAELKRLGADGLEASHMGRGPSEDRLFFLAAGAAGLHAGNLLETL